MIAIANDNVPDAHGHADAAGALDLGTADLDRIAVADIVLDRICQPRRGDVEIDRPGAEPPPQHGEADRCDDEQATKHGCDALEPAATTMMSPARAEAIAETMPD